MLLGVSVTIATIVIVGTVIAVKRNRRPPQERQVADVPAASVKRREEFIMTARVPNEATTAKMHCNNIINNL